MNRPLVPEFLKKIDKNLLLHKPNTWSTRVHFVVWYSFLFSVALAFICWVMSSDPRDYSTIETGTVVVSLFCFVGLVTWLIYLLRFNVFKKFGIQKPGDGVKIFLLFFIGMAALVFPAYIPSIVETLKANKEFKTDKIVRDVNEINKKICQLEYNKFPKKWEKDTIVLVQDKRLADSIMYAVRNSAEESSDNAVEVENVINIEQDDLELKLASADSIVKISDSVYIEYECPRFTFVDASTAPSYSSVGLISSFEMYKMLIQNYKPPKNKEQISNELEQLLVKYRRVNRYEMEYGYNDYSNETTYDQKIVYKYKLAEVDNGIRNICRKKYRFAEELPIYIRVFVYTALILALLLFIFRHTTTAAFFFSLLTAFIICVITGVFIAMSNGDEKSFFIAYLAYNFLFMAISIPSSTDRRSLAKGIAINLFTVTTPFVPLILVGLYYAILRDQYSWMEYNEEYRKMFEHEDLHLHIAEITGLVLLVVFTGTLFKYLYRKWYASPED